MNEGGLGPCGRISDTHQRNPDKPVVSENDQVTLSGE